MSLRTQFKVPRYGLFYFESDKTVCTVPLKKISKVLQGDNTSKGSIVEVAYGNANLKAQIIAVHDDQNELKDKEMEFICDPRNRQLFSEDDDEMELNLPEKDEGKRKAEEQTMPEPEELVKKQKRKNEGKSNKTKKVTKNEKDQATIIARFEPGKDSVINEPSTPKPPISPISRSSSPISVSPLSSLNSRNTPVQSTPTHFTPRPSPLRRSGRTSGGVLSHRPVACSLSSRYTEIPSVLHRDSELLWILTRIEKKIDNLASLEEKIDNLTASQILNDKPSLSESLNVHHNYVPTPTPMPAPQSSSSMHFDDNDRSTLGLSDEAQLTPNDETSAQSEWLLDNDRLMQVRHQANSSANFAVRLVREMFKPNELVGRNVSGVRGKEQLDPVRLDKIMGLVYQFYPAPPADRPQIAKNCRVAIDSFLRRQK